MNIQEFNVNDTVFITIGKKKKKDEDPCLGPFIIIQKLSDYNYKIIKPDGSKCQIVNVKRLKKFKIDEWYKIMYMYLMLS